MRIFGIVLRTVLWCIGLLTGILLSVLILSESLSSDLKMTLWETTTPKIQDSIRIVCLTDLHQTVFGEDNQELISRISALSPDAIVIAGDLINHENPDYVYAESLCSALAKIAVVFFSYGDEENKLVYGSDLTESFFTDHKDESGTGDNLSRLCVHPQLNEILQKAGVNILQGSSQTLQIGKSLLEIGGTSIEKDAVWAQAGSFLTDAYGEEASDRYRILLVHNPETVLSSLKDVYADLAISGHMHGGIIRLPKIGPIISKLGGFFPKHTEGEEELSHGSLVISTGLGNNGMIPRLFNPPEILVIDLN